MREGNVFNLANIFLKTRIITILNSELNAFMKNKIRVTVYLILVSIILNVNARAIKKKKHIKRFPHWKEKKNVE